MVRKFDAIRTKYSRAVQIWQILIGLAHNRQTTTYGMLGKQIGFEGVGIIGQFLDPIMRYCKANNLPPLTIVVVNETTGSPGEGLVTLANENLDREAVFHYDWYNLYPPGENDFAALFPKS